MPRNTIVVRHLSDHCCLQPCIGELIKSHVMQPHRLISLSDGLWSWFDGGLPYGLDYRYDDDSCTFVLEPKDSPLNNTINTARLSDSVVGCAVFQDSGHYRFITDSTTVESVKNPIGLGWTPRDPYPASTTLILPTTNGSGVLVNVDGQMVLQSTEVNGMVISSWSWFCRLAAENAVGIRIRIPNEICLFGIDGKVLSLKSNINSSTVTQCDLEEYTTRYHDKMVWLTKTELCVLSVNVPQKEYSIQRYPLAEECRGKRVRFPIAYLDSLFAFRRVDSFLAVDGGIRLLQISLAGAATSCVSAVSAIATPKQLLPQFQTLPNQIV